MGQGHKVFYTKIKTKSKIGLGLEILLEPPIGFEPTTCSLRVSRSTN